MPHKIKTTWNEQEYESRAKAADANHITDRAMRIRIGRGYTSDADMEAYHPLGQPIIYEGVRYRSLRSCARSHHKTDYAMRKLIKGV